MASSKDYLEYTMALEMMPDAALEFPYEGGSKMIMNDTEDRDLIREVVIAMYDEIPAPRKKKTIESRFRVHLL